MLHEFQRQRSFLAGLLVVALLGIAIPAGASGGAGGAGGSGGAGGAGGGGGENIGVAQEADDSLCCCTVPGVDGSMMSCQVVASSAGCPPYTTDYPGACSSGPRPGTGACSASVVRSGAGGVEAVEVIVLLLTFAAFRRMLRRLARG